MMVALITTWGTLLSAIVTAVATLFLWRVTRLLATETTRMADASGRPQVVASIVPNEWSARHLDLQVENTGNATAFNIEVSFDPALLNGEARENHNVPLQSISILKPGQRMSSYLSDVGDYLDKSYEVTISWRTSPNASSSEALRYVLNMGDYKEVSYLGERSPMVQVAQQLKKLREDWQHVAGGSRRVSANTFDGSDRQRESDAIEARLMANRAARAASEAVAPSPPPGMETKPIKSRARPPK